MEKGHPLRMPFQFANKLVMIPAYMGINGRKIFCFIKIVKIIDIFV